MMPFDEVIPVSSDVNPEDSQVIEDLLYLLLETYQETKRSSKTI